MRQTEPPSAATWILEHLTPGPRNEALAGDLLEELRCGRSVGWYWRQALAAVAIGCFVEIVNHRFVLLFAALWSMMVPGWSLYAFRMEAHGDLIGRIWRIDWPWSTICDLGLSLGMSLVFIWTGLLLFLVPHMGITRGFNLRRIWQALLQCAPPFIAVSALLYIVMLLPVHMESASSTHALRAPMDGVWVRNYVGGGWWGRFIPNLRMDTEATIEHPIDTRALTPLERIMDIRVWANVTRLPYFLSMLYALWGVTSLSENRRRRIAA